MKLLYLTACRQYGAKLREVNNTYRAAYAGMQLGVTLGGPGFDWVVDVPCHLPTYLQKEYARAYDADVIFLADPWHNFWDPCATYPDCPSLYTGIDEVDRPIVFESGDSQFYTDEIKRHLGARPQRAVCIRAESHAWRFAGFPVFYLPHGAYDEMVEVSRGIAKAVDVFFSGSDLPDSYPARARIAKALRKAGALFKTDWLPHPSDHAHDVIGPAFWRRIARARIAVAGTNAYQNLTMRYLEIPASGALAIGDVPVPEGSKDAWAETMIDIGENDTDDIIALIRDALADPERLAIRTNAAREFVLSRHHFRMEWARVVGEIEEWLR